MNQLVTLVPCCKSATMMIRTGMWRLSHVIKVRHWLNEEFEGTRFRLDIPYFVLIRERKELKR